MNDLTVTGVDNGSLLVATDSGEHFRLAVDETLHARIRQASAQLGGAGAKVAPKEIQTHIRSGMTAEDVAALTGASLESVQRFEGAILAERAYVVESALNVPVHTALDPDLSHGASTFGSVIRSRLANLDATDERWASWKEPAGEWMIKLSFTANEIDHDARWKFEPKRQVLAPVNGEAHTLSQQEEIAGALIPRLRAVGGDERVQDSSRFDSGAFDLDTARMGTRDTMPNPAAPHTGATHTGVLPFGRSTTSSPEATAAAVNRAPQTIEASSQTADLLEALRRRRGERESASWGDADGSSSDTATADGASSSAGFVSAVDVPLDAFDDLDVFTVVDDSAPSTRGFEPRHSGTRRSSNDHQSSEYGQTAPTRHTAPGADAQGGGGFTAQARGGRKGRAAMPSWDEIVFGAKSDDDLG